jgi:hypothetical protein
MASQEMLGLNAQQNSTPLDELQRQTDTLSAVAKNLKSRLEVSKIAAKGEDAPTVSNVAKELLARIDQPVERQIDYRPLFAAASPGVREALLAATSKPNVLSPEEERMATLASLSAKLTPNNTSDYQKEALMLRQQQLGLQQQQEDRRKGQFGFQKSVRPIETFNRDKIVVNANSALSASKQAAEMVDLNNPIAASAVKRSLARLSGEVGVMTDRDVADFAGSKAWKDQMIQFAKMAESGTLTQANQDYMRQLLNKMVDVQNRILENRADKYDSQFGSVYGMPRGELKNQLLGNLPEEKQTEPTSVKLEEYKKLMGR